MPPSIVSYNNILDEKKQVICYTISMKNIYKTKKNILILITIIFTILTIIELIKYLLIDSNFFGLVYMIINIMIIFLLVPTVYNYNKYYSPQRISKLIIIIVLGLFNSTLLGIILINTMDYIDHSQEYIKSIFVIKNVLKVIIYLLLGGITFLEFNTQKLFQNNEKEKIKIVKKKIVKRKKNKNIK